MVVILGAGITGAAVAYYLAKLEASSSASSSLQQQQQQQQITIIDSVGPAAGSSGKAGAFIYESSSWSSSSSNNHNNKAQILHEESFALHEQLSKELKLNSWHEVTGHYFVSSSSTKDGNNKNPMLQQLSGRCAQVDPKELTNSLLDGAIRLGNVKLEIDTVASIRMTTSDDDDNTQKLESIQLQSGQIVSVVDDIVVIALGPWSCRIEDWLQIPIPIEGVLSTSMIWRKQQQQQQQNTSSDTLPDDDDDYFSSFFNIENNNNDSSSAARALFCQEDDQWGCHLEVIPRNDKSIYVSGCGNSQIINPAILRGPNRPIPGEEQPDHSRIQSVRKNLQNVLSNLDDSKGQQKEKEKEQKDNDVSQSHNYIPQILPPPPDEIRACIRPNSPDGIPLVGKILDNCYVATGGGPWGVTYGPLMGKEIAKQIIVSSADNDEIDDDSPPVNTIRPNLWHPRRFDTLVYKLLMKQRQKEAWGG